VQAKAATPLSTAAAVQVTFCVRIVPVVLFLFSIPVSMPPVRHRTSCQFSCFLSKDCCRYVVFVTFGY